MALTGHSWLSTMVVVVVQLVLKQFLLIIYVKVYKRFFYLKIKLDGLRRRTVNGYDSAERVHFVSL